MSDYKYYTPIALVDALLEYFPVKDISCIVDISCGPFNLLKSAQKKFPNARCVGIDIEEQDTSDCSNVEFVKQDGRIFAKEQNANGNFFDLILTNPPFGRLEKEKRLFENEANSVLCSRYECEMMYANTLLAKEGTLIIAILPTTFVEGELYLKYREKLAEEYEINLLVKLPSDVFSKGEISAYAVVLRKSSCEKKRPTSVGEAIFDDLVWKISCERNVPVDSVQKGIWNPLRVQVADQKKKVDQIFRGNISSVYFSENGDKILHCSSKFEEGEWVPSQRYCSGYQTETPRYVTSGDIIINRIGKNAGYWTKYSGEKQLVSDCLIVIRGGKQIEEFLACHSVEGRLAVPIRGVATKYISISDLTSMYFEI